MANGKIHFLRGDAAVFAFHRHRMKAGARFGEKLLLSGSWSKKFFLQILCIKLQLRKVIEQLAEESTSLSCTLKMVQLFAIKCVWIRM